MEKRSWTEGRRSCRTRRGPRAGLLKRNRTRTAADGSDPARDRVREVSSQAGGPRGGAPGQTRHGRIGTAASDGRAPTRSGTRGDSVETGSSPDAAGPQQHSVTHSGQSAAQSIPSMWGVAKTWAPENATRIARTATMRSGIFTGASPLGTVPHHPGAADRRQGSPRAPARGLRASAFLDGPVELEDRVSQPALPGPGPVIPDRPGPIRATGATVDPGCRLRGDHGCANATSRSTGARRARRRSPEAPRRDDQETASRSVEDAKAGGIGRPKRMAGFQGSCSRSGVRGTSPQRLAMSYASSTS